MILACQKTPVALTPYLYTQIAFAMLGGWLALSHVPDHWSLVDILSAICGAAGARLTARENRALNQFSVRPAES